MSVRIGETAASHREPGRGICSIVLAAPVLVLAALFTLWRKTR